jgi:hypothetical protein
MGRKFKPGDRVSIKNLGFYYPEPKQGLFVNNTGTVRCYDDQEQTFVLVATDGDTWSPKCGLSSAWEFAEAELELLGDSNG